MEVINKSEDKIEVLLHQWRELLVKFDERKLRQHAKTLSDDISNFHFDFASDSSKFEVLGNKFLEIIKKSQDDEILQQVNLYWLHEKMMKLFAMESREQECFSMIFEMMDDDRTRDISLLNEFMAGRHVMRNLNTLDKSLLDQIFGDAKHKNVRNFMNGVLQHESFPVEINSENLSIDIILHRCVDEKLIFLLDLFTPRLQTLSTEEALKVLSHTDATGNTIFHLACDRRIKFFIEELWTIIQRVYGEDSKKINDFLIAKNNDDRNVFQLAFQMPFKYTDSDYANEIKGRDSLLHYYRVRGLLELEMYNFESCLNFVFDIARRNVNDKHKKSLIVDYKSKKGNYHRDYEYSKDFAGFRHEFLQLRYYCITKLAAIKTDDADKSAIAYNFLSHYIENYMANQDEDGIIDIYQKLSFDACMTAFFKSFVKNFFNQAMLKVRRNQNVKIIFEATSKALSESEYHRLLMERGANGNNALQEVIESGHFILFKQTFQQIKNKNTIINWLTSKNNDKINSLYMIIAQKSTSMLNVVFNYFSNNLDEDEIMKILEDTVKANYKFLDVCVLMYDREVFNLVLSYLDTYISFENFKKLIGDSIIFIAVSKWQESVTNTVLNLLPVHLDESEIKKILCSKNWEGQTAFHSASKNHNLSQLQTLCKFAHAFLSKEDFIEIITHCDSNEFNIVNPEAPKDSLYQLLPNVSNFSSDRPRFEWAPYFESIPANAIEFGKEADESVSYVGRTYNESDEEFKFELIKVTPSLMISDGQCIDILVGQGLKWVAWSSENNNSNEIKVEKKEGVNKIVKIGSDLKLLEEVDEQCEILVVDESEVYEAPGEWIFRRSRW